MESEGQVSILNLEAEAGEVLEVGLGEQVVVVGEEVLEEDEEDMVEEEEVLVVEMEVMDEVFGVAVVVAALEEVTEDHMDVEEGVLEEEEEGLGHSSSVTLFVCWLYLICLRKLSLNKNSFFSLLSFGLKLMRQGKPITLAVQHWLQIWKLTAHWTFLVP